MKASDVLDAHRRTRESLADPYVEDQLTGYMQALYSGHFGDVDPETVPDAKWQEFSVAFNRSFHPASGPEEFTQRLSGELFAARTYQITEEMIDAITGTHDEASSHSGTLTFDIHDLPSPNGFAWLDKEVALADNEHLPVQAISWGLIPTQYKDGSTRQGVRIVLWVNGASHVYMSEKSRAEWFKWTHGKFPLVFGYSIVVPFREYVERNAEGVETLESFISWAHVMWMFLDMEITARVRPTIRPFSMKKFTQSMQEPPEVQVIYLRRTSMPKDPDHEPHPIGPIDWSCRWPVQGHHRHLDQYEMQRHHAIPDAGQMNKVCTTCGGRITWVHPYLKGPDGKPLRSLEQLYRLAR